MATIGNQTVEFTSGAKTSLTVSPITFPTGRDTGDFASFVATIREDPDYLRRTLPVDPLVDPVAEGWDVIGTATGTADSATSVTFEFSSAVTSLLEGSERRYVVDAWGLGGTAGPAAILDTNWITKVRPRASVLS